MSPKPIALWLATLTVLCAVAKAQSVLIPMPDRRDHVFDSSRGVLCISTAHGAVERYDVATSSFLSAIPAGMTLRGLDITPDSAFLYATDEATSGGSAFIRKVNLASLAVTSLAFALEPSEGGSYDIAIANNGRALFTTSGGGGGEFPVREVLLANDSIAVRTDFQGFFD